MKSEIKDIVKKSYGQIAVKGGSCCCGGGSAKVDISRIVGYSDKELKSLPEGADLGLGCGNPVALASLKEGETVLDLGSGAGVDCFLAADKVGKSGKVIGVDMTPEMIDRATKNAAKGNYTNVEFRPGEIENLPVEDCTIDAVISNCVINLVPDKQKAFKEIFRVLKPGGRMMVSDIVLTKELPDAIKKSVSGYIGCVSGAMIKDDYLNAIEKACFGKPSVVGEKSFPLDCILNDPFVKNLTDELKMPFDELKNLADSILSVQVSAVKPA